MKRFLIANSTLLLISALGFWTIETDSFFVLRVASSIAILVSTFILPGVYGTLILERLRKKRFSFFEYATVSILLSLCLPPLLLSIEYRLFGSVFPTLPLINSFLLFGGAALLLFFGEKQLPPLPDRTPIFPNEKRSVIELVLSFLFFVGIALLFTTAYFPLPDLDPYYWLMKFEKLFVNGALLPLSYRPLFSSLVYIFTVGAHIDFYSFFKYLLPSFFLLLLAPTFLIAQTFRRLDERAVLILSPFSSGISIIFLMLPIPQALASLFLFSSSALLFHSLRSKDPFFFFAGGLLLFFGSFYHESLALPFTLWGFFTALSFRKELLLLSERILSSFLLLLLLAPRVLSPLSFLVERLGAFLPAFLHFHPNFQFPLSYVNVDGAQMGWGTWTEMLLYYAFYVGPVLSLLLGLITVSLFRKRQTRHTLWAALPKETLVVGSIFLAFFSIAEILPRIVGIAYLPDRAWVFCALLSPFFLAIFLHSFRRISKILTSLFLVGLLINLGAAIFINEKKQYVITEAELRSAEWIRKIFPKIV
ncbi:MAG: hypothetical protein IPL87_03535 [Candidatus Moraniibacteriota bacterium]|nr:MAG: hypothetical protein IPL87_03535 [Candidatus Moranbacteria bacterium]